MPSPVWTGVIGFGLVSIPVRLLTAVEPKDIRFNLLHRKDGSRIVQRYECLEDGEPVEWRELVRGYEVGPGRRRRSKSGLPICVPPIWRMLRCNSLAQDPENCSSR